MSEFSTSSLLEVTVDQRSLREARDTIEGELGDVQVDVSTSGAAAASGGGRSGSVRGREQAMHRQLLSSQNQELSDIGESWEQNIELNERRNDLLEQLVESNQQGNRVRARSMGGGLALAAGGVAAVAGVLSGVPQALADSLGSLVSESIPAGNLIDGTIGPGELIEGGVPAADLVDDAVGAASLISGGVGLASLVSTTSIGSLLTPVSIGTLLEPVSLGSLINQPAGDGSPSDQPSPTNDPSGDPTGDGSGFSLPNIDPATGIAALGAAGVGAAKFLGSRGAGAAAGLATPVFTKGMLPDNAPDGLGEGPTVAEAFFQSLDDMTPDTDPLRGQTVGADGSAIGTTSPTDIGPTSSDLPSVSGSALEGGDARLATIAAQQTQGEALELGEDDDDEDSETVVQDNRKINVDASFELPRDDRQMRQEIQRELNEFERRLERRFTNRR